MRAGSVGRSCLLALLLLFAASVCALTPGATSPAPGPFEALVGDAKCHGAPAHEAEAHHLENTTHVVEPSYPSEGPKDAVEAQEAVMDANLPAPTSTTVEPPLSLVTMRVGDSQEQPELLEFPSFAEWKERHLANAAAAAMKDAHHGSHRKRVNHSHEGRQHDGLSKSAEGSDHKDVLVEESTAVPADESGAKNKETSNGKGEELSSNFASVPSTNFRRVVQPIPHAGTGDPVSDPLVLLRDRTNYASFDCSATLIRTSKRTKSASAILSSKKDRYMLSPCSASEKFVIIELCDEIQIDTIVLANLEFFSSMFKLFRIKAGTAYPESTGTWQELGTFRASNVRGLQVGFSCNSKLRSS